MILPNPDSVDIIHRDRPECKPGDYLSYQAQEDTVPPMAAYGDEHILHVTSSCHDETGRSNSKPAVNTYLLRRLRDKIYKHVDDIVEVEHFGPQEADVLIITFGVASRVAKEAIVRAQKEGVTSRLLRIITMWPFPEREVRQALDRARAVIIPEMNQGQMIHEVQRLNTRNVPVHPLSRFDGELITPAEIMTRIREVV
jgi:2-oxoglutarate ferredoxin oxidoreductase subunit alpha